MSLSHGLQHLGSYYAQGAMKEKVEEHLANLLSIGFSREQVNEKGYEYALALQTDASKEGSPVTAEMMRTAAELVKGAIPGAYRIYERRTMMH